MKTKFELSKLIKISFVLISANFFILEHSLAGKRSSKPIFLPGYTSQRNADQSGGQTLLPAPPTKQLARADNYFQMIESGTLDNFEQFDAFASLSEGVIKGATVKFLIDNRSSPSQIHFINGNYNDSNGSRPEYVKYHYYFAQHSLGLTQDLDTFNKETYFTNNLEAKKFIAGTLQLYEFINSSGAKQSILGIQFYPQDVISENTLFFAIQQLKKAIKLTGYSSAFVAYGSQQTFSTIKEQLRNIDILPMTVDQIYGNISYLPMQQGTTYGYLRFFPKGDSLDNLGPLDIPVFNELPLDLSVVAGVISTVVQDAGAHVNLKSKERNTPNMVLKDQELIKLIETYNNKPIKMVVGSEKPEFILLEDETHTADDAKAIVQNFFSDKMKNKKWVQISSGKDSSIELFDDMAAKNTPQQLVKKASSYGGKASKLALLANQLMVGMGSELETKYNYRISPMGFSVPVNYYSEFINNNSELNKKLIELINKEMALEGQIPPSSRERTVLVNEVQNLFYNAEVPPALFQAITDSTTQLINFGTKAYPNSPLKKVKVRSSSNAEDIPQFDGAGLHSSYSASLTTLGDPKESCKIEITKDDDGVSTKENIVPNTMMCAIKGVYASLWNKRAIEERNFAKIDQRSATMGLAVNVNYDFRKKTENIKEIANAVLVTKIINTKGVFGYRLSVNTSENLVTNPTPQTQSEISMATFLDLKEQPQYSFIQFAKTAVNTPILDKPLLSSETYNRLIEIARNVEYNYCKHIPSYYPNKNCAWVVVDPDKPSSLDMEFKIFSNGEVIIKQVREFSGE